MTTTDERELLTPRVAARRIYNADCEDRPYGKAMSQGEMDDHKNTLYQIAESIVSRAKQDEIPAWDLALEIAVNVALWRVTAEHQDTHPLTRHTAALYLLKASLNHRIAGAETSEV